MGDMHFSQGDGEVSFCGAIEMAGFLDLKCTSKSCTEHLANGIYMFIKTHT